MSNESLTEAMIRIASHASSIIMEYYDADIDVEVKQDNSPVTIADLKANQYIVQALTEYAPHIPIVSEEGSQDTNREVLGSPRFFLVDPLDGTKSFIKRTNEFTVNIALIQMGFPVAGIVTLPALSSIYYTSEDGNAYKDDGHGPVQIKTRIPSDDGVDILASRSHRTEATDRFIATQKIRHIVSASSSLKFCYIAEGKADLYPRFGPTNQWDTAAGDAILRAAGGFVTRTDGSILTYGGTELLNPEFIAWGYPPTIPSPF